MEFMFILPPPSNPSARVQSPWYTYRYEYVSVARSDIDFDELDAGGYETRKGVKSFKSSIIARFNIRREISVRFPDKYLETTMRKIRYRRYGKENIIGTW